MFEDGKPTSGSFEYVWADNSLAGHTAKVITPLIFELRLESIAVSLNSKQTPVRHVNQLIFIIIFASNRLHL